MALSLARGKAGFKPDYIDATAQVTVAPQDGGFKITGSHIVCEASVPGIDQTTFAQHAQAARIFKAAARLDRVDHTSSLRRPCANGHRQRW